MSITSDLDLSTIVKTAIASLKVKLPILSAFSTDFGAQVKSVGTSVTVPLIGAKTGGAFSGNYTTDASNSVTSTKVTLDKSTDSGTGLTDIEYADTGLQILGDYLKEDVYAVARVVVDNALDIITVANYANEYVKAAASFDLDSVIALKTQAMALGWDRGTIVLNADAYANFLGEYVDAVTFTPGQDPNVLEFLGFKIICYPNLPTTETMIGFCCNPISIAVASRPVAIPPNAKAGGTTVSVTTEADSGISLGLRSYYSNDTGRQIQIIHQVHGAAVGLTNGLIRIVWSDQIGSTSSESSLSSPSSPSSPSSKSSLSSPSSKSSLSSLSSSSQSSLSSPSSKSSLSSLSSSSESSLSSVSSISSISSISSNP